jgi:UDP-3-O-[3-hydroxymyristoyl] N-acetylglucosamine deacetylase
MKAGRQTTLRDRAELSGVGVHSGAPVSLTIHPAASDTGIVFFRTVEGGNDREISANSNAVVATEFATVLGDASGPAVATVEHIMAALCGMGVDNALIEIDGPEVPVLDGSAEPFAEAIEQAGIETLPQARRYLRVLKPIGVTSGNSYAELRPYDRGFRLEMEIDFDHRTVGRQNLALDLTPVTFRRELSRARTFGFMRDVHKLWNSGYALGASFANTVVVAEDRVVNPDGLRFSDEFVRHKALDALGDLALAGAPILGAYRSICGGHRLNHAVLCALFADKTAWTLVDAREPAVRRTRGHADLGAGLLQPAYAPDVS